MNPNIYMVTVADKPRKTLALLEKSCEINGVKLKILGLDRSEIRIGSKFGFGWKLMLLRDYLDKLKEDDIFIFVDAYDVVMVTNINEVLQKFLEFKTHILFSAEHFCSPDKKKHEKYLTKKMHGQNYLNSGTFMGFIGPFKRFYDENRNIITEKTDDQRYYTDLYLKHQINQNKIKLDHDSRIFMCLAGVNDKLIYNNFIGRYQNKITKEYPCIIHANGANKFLICNFDIYKLIRKPKINKF